MTRSRLPLTALRSFEAAGRHQSFTLAANELFVSQAAVSRQIRDLEALVGQQLFTRHAQKVELTSPGSQLLSVLSSAFDSIELGIADINFKSSHFDISLSVEPAFASCWLLPKLKGFQETYPSIEVCVETDHRVIEFLPHEPEIAIRYAVSTSKWKNTQCKHLYDAEMIAVLSPKLLEEPELVFNTPEAFLQFQLLHEYGVRDWQNWFIAANYNCSKSIKGHTFDHMGLVLQAALDGQGAAILDKNFVSTYLDTGELIQPVDISFKYGAYWIVTADFSKLKEPARQFIRWVQSKV